MLLIRILLLSLALCNIAEVQASVGSSVAWSLQLEYDLMGRESLRRLLGGVESRTRYDRSGHVTDQVTQGVGYEVSHRSYDWDLSGKLRKLTAGSYTAEFDYDVVGTLAAARYNETDILYKLPDRFAKEARYERGGRRKEDKEWTYHFDGEGFLAQRVSKAESIERYDWIHRKLLVEPLTWTYEWDGTGQLVRVKNNKKVNLRFEYDALGRRVAKINEYGKAEGHKITRFLWDGNVPLHEWSYPLSERPETIDDSDGRRSYASPEPQTELTTWIFDEGTFVPSAKLVGDRRYSIISDYLGTPIEAYDEEGKRVWARELDIYGRTRSEEGAVGFIPFLYQGQYLDGETGLAYNRFRYYSPETGAYISQDPIRLEAGLTNLYAYVHDVNAWIDPWGLVKRIYEKASYHGKVDTAIKSKAPKNGQEALDSSVQVKLTSPRRVGVDKINKELVVLDQTLITPEGIEVYHGHVRAWEDLHPDQKKVLQDAGLVDKKGKIKEFH